MFFRSSQYLFFLFLCLLSQALDAQRAEARQEVGLDRVVEQFGLSGRNVLVVMIDRGIDYHHPDFLNPDGTTRLAYVFDMINDAGADDPDNPYGVGTILDRAELNADLMTDGPPLSNDNHGHGTATTGIMVGNGGGTPDSAFAGVAPAATIISIKLVQDGFPAAGGQPGEDSFFRPDYIPIALQFARDKIEELGLPSVTLLNIGSIGGPTDGTSTVGRAIADFAADHAFVCGTGDDGGADNTFRGAIDRGETLELTLDKQDAGNLDWNLWYPDGARLDVELTLPDGSTLGPTTPPTNATREEVSGGNVTIWHNGSEVDFFGSTAARREIFIRIAEGTGRYQLRLTATVAANDTVFATINPANFGRNNAFVGVGSNQGSIADYSASSGVITPGDYVIDPSWQSVDGTTYRFQNQGAPGEIWLGSSRGPTQDGRLGIDLVAPGEVLFGAYSPGSFYSRNVAGQVAGGNGLYGIQNAVSAAAPLTAGVIALMLEADPTLTPAEVLDILQRTAREDNFTGTTPNVTYGYGKLDALAAVEEVRRLSSTNQRVNLTGLDLFPNPARHGIELRYAGSTVVRAVELTDVAGRPISHWNGLPGRIDLGPLPVGTYLLRVVTDSGVGVRAVVKQ